MDQNRIKNKLEEIAIQHNTTVVDILPVATCDICDTFLKFFSLRIKLQKEYYLTSFKNLIADLCDDYSKQFVLGLLYEWLSINSEIRKIILDDITY